VKGIFVEPLPHAEVNRMTLSREISGTVCMIASLDDGGFFPTWFTRESGWLGSRVDSEARAAVVVSNVVRGVYTRLAGRGAE